MMSRKIDLSQELERIRKERADLEITKVMLQNYDESFKASIDEGYGFIIDENIDYNEYFRKSKVEDIKKITEENSIYSYKYGISISDEERVIDKMYSCNCGKLTGVENLDYICNVCHSPVTRLEPKKIGWLILNGGYKIIHPFILYILFVENSPIEKLDRKSAKKEKEKASLAKRSQAIAEENKEATEEDEIEDDRNYNPLAEEEEDIKENEIEEVKEEEEEVPKKKKEKKKPKVKKYYTLIEALNSKKLDFTWEDILNPNGEKLELFIAKYLRKKYDVLMLYRNIWYTNKIEVISKNYRFLSVFEVEVAGANKIVNHNINVLYQDISASVMHLNGSPLENPRSWVIDQLKAICNAQAKIGNYIFQEIGSSKKSHIRAEIYGKRYTFSGRLVIESIVDPKITRIDVCQVPIDYFRSTFINDILTIGKKLQIDPVRLRNLMDIDYVLTDEDRRLLKDTIFPLVEEPVLYVNREPDIYVTSILGLRIHSLIDEMVLRVPFFILPSISGDSKCTL